MGNKLPRFQNALTLVLGAATTTLLWLPGPMHAQSTATQSTATQSTTTQDRQATTTQDRQAAPSDDITHRDLAQFDQFLDSHREDAEQLRKTPSLINDPQFLQSHPELNAYLQEHPSVKQEISERPDTFMRLEDSYNRDPNARDRDAGGQDRNTGRRDEANLGRFLDGHREIAEQIRKDPSLLDNRNFVQSHPALQTYLQDNPGVRDQLRQDPNTFTQQAEIHDRDSNLRGHDAMNDRMAGFGGFLGSHSDIQRDLSRDPSKVKDHEYVQNHAELNTYLNAHPDVRNDLMANPQSFVQGAKQYNNGGATGTASGAGVNGGRGTGTTGSMGTTGSSTGTSTGTSTTSATTHPKPNQ